MHRDVIRAVICRSLFTHIHLALAYIVLPLAVYTTFAAMGEGDTATVTLDSVYMTSADSVDILIHDDSIITAIPNVPENSILVITADVVSVEFAESDIYTGSDLDSATIGSNDDHISQTPPPLDTSNIFNILFFAASIVIIILAIFFYRSRRRRNTKRFLTTMRLSVLDRTIQKGCRYIESNYANPNLSIKEVCRELVTGEAYLDALFVKEVGINVHEFIAQVRVNCIKHILAAEPMANVHEVYTECGFTDRMAAEACFTRSFKMGIDEYIKSLRKN